MHIDGQTLRRGFDGSTATAALQMVSAWVDDLSICLGRIQTTAEPNAITAVPLLLELLEVRGAVVTLDATHCQTKTITKIRDKQADYTITVKENQDELYTQVSSRLEHLAEQGFPSRLCKTERTIHNNRGRIEEHANRYGQHNTLGFKGPMTEESENFAEIEIMALEKPKAARYRRIRAIAFAASTENH